MTNINSTEQNSSLSQSLYNELEGLKIRIAFAEIDEEELDEFEQDLTSVSKYDYSDAAQKKALKLIERKMNKQLRKQFVMKTLPRTLQVVTISLLLFFIGLTTAIATVRPVRLRILDFIAQIEENYSTVSIIHNENDEIYVPEGWGGEYYPLYVPEEFSLARVDNFFNMVHYTTTDNRVLEFCESPDTEYRNNSIINIDYFDVEIGGCKGIASVTDNQVTIVWSIDDSYFTLYFIGDLNEAVRIAENVQRIKR